MEYDFERINFSLSLKDWLSKMHTGLFIFSWIVIYFYSQNLSKVVDFD